jgi:hypothetical protein
MAAAAAGASRPAGSSGSRPRGARFWR